VEPLNEIDNKIAKGAAWMVSFKLIDRGLGLVSTVILARLLLPADFGLVAMAMILIGALQVLISFSFDVSLIQNPNAGRDHFDTAWTLNMLFALVCGLILAFLASGASQFYREPRLEAVIYLLAAGFGIQGLSNVGTVIFRREMRFDREFKFLLSKRLVSVLITVPLALWLKSYLALVIGQLSGTVAAVALSYIVSNYRPRFSLKAKGELFHTSKWLMLNNVLQFLNGRAVELSIGRFAGAQTLGVYTIASEISTLPTTELVAPINRAAFSGYAKAASETEQLRSSFLNVISVIGLFALPAGVGIVLLADLIVPAILGRKWLAAIPLIQVLAIYGVIQALQTNIGYVYLAVGKPRLITITSALQFVILMAFLVPAVQRWGATGAAWAVLASVVIMIPVNQVLIAKRLNLSWAGFLMKLVRPLAASAAMGCGIWSIKVKLDLRPDTAAYILALVVCVFAGALLYVFALYALWRLASRPNGPERFCLSKIEDALHKVGIKIKLVRC
jgi:lipopolysaccharide exporter